MEPLQGNKSDWVDKALAEATTDAGVSVAAVVEEGPAFTVTTIATLTIVVLFAIFALFVLGVFLDCRQQRLIERKKCEVKRLRNQSRGVSVTTVESDGASIANNMEETGQSCSPAEILQNVP